MSYTSTVTTDPGSCANTAVDWAQMALNSAVPLHDHRVNQALAEAIRQLQLAIELIDRAGKR